MSFAMVLAALAGIAVVAFTYVQDWGQPRSPTWIVMGVLLAAICGLGVGAIIGGVAA